MELSYDFTIRFYSIFYFIISNDQVSLSYRLCSNLCRAKSSDLDRRGAILSRWGDRTSVDMPRAYVFINLTFCDRNLGTEPSIDCFWLRTAFLAFATYSSCLHLEVVATSGICF